MSIPRAVFLVTLGLVSCAHPAKEPVVRAPSPPAGATRAVAAPARTMTVQIIVVPSTVPAKGVPTEKDDAIKNWLRARRGGVQPWDIIVIGDKPWMFVHDHLVPHDHHNYHSGLGTVHLSVSRRDQLRWESDRKFCITGNKKEGEPTNPNAPDNPFPKLRTKEGGTKETCSESDFRVESGPSDLNESQLPQRYKFAFRVVEGPTIDPDYVCER